MFCRTSTKVAPGAAKFQDTFRSPLLNDSDFFYCLDKKTEKYGIFLFDRPPAPNFLSQNDANQTYFQLLLK